MLLVVGNLRNMCACERTCTPGRAREKRRGSGPPADDDNLSGLTTPLDTLACFGLRVKAVIIDLFWVTLAAKRLLKQNLITII